MHLEDWIAELSALDLVDAHCHPLRSDPTPLTVEEFLAALTLQEHRKSLPGWPAGVPGTVMQDDLLRMLAGAFGLAEGTGVAQVVAERNRRSVWPGRYVRELFGRERVRALVVDTASPRPQIPLEEFQALAGLPCRELFRIEPLVQQLLNDGRNWGELRRAYLDAIHTAARGHYCGLKSTIAYRTGLIAEAASAVEAGGALAIFRATGSKPALKPLWDWCLLEAIKAGGEAGKPVQIHTGMGDAGVRLGTSHAAGLFNVLRLDPYKRTQVVLVHGGFPWPAETGYMAHVLTNVFVDFSLQCPFAGAALAGSLRQLLALTPVHKLMWGSDGFGIPEITWYAAVVGRRVLARVLADLEADGFIDRRFGVSAARRILADNARQLYRLA